jgi:methylated-DNA-[protein]-cysteine S-methyltransferase
MHWGGVGNLEAGSLADHIKNEIDEYFAGRLTKFTIPVAPNGTAFQQSFYDALCAIPYGETRTYGDLAGELKVSAQAIGQACGANPIAIIIPCHRVLGASNLGGFSGVGGVETKVELLKLEGAGSLLI